MAALVLAGCAARAPSACLLPAQKPMTDIQLFFGRAMAGGGEVGETEWSQFSRDVLARNFPDGFTVMDGVGSWFNPASHSVIGEPSRVVLIAAAPAPDTAQRILAVTEDYKRRFQQLAVGILSAPACGAF